MNREAILERMGELIERAEDLKSSARQPCAPSLSGYIVERTPYHQWETSVIQVLESAVGRDGNHFVRAMDTSRESDARGWRLQVLEGILRAAKDDIEAGALADMKQLLRAEIFEDLLGQAEYLVGEGYHLPAGALAGAVLEDTLRKLCEKNEIAWEGHSSIGKLNAALYEEKVYDNPQRGQIEAWGQLRNKIDHGDFSEAEEVESGVVERMISGVRDFIVKYLS